MADAAKPMSPEQQEEDFATASPGFSVLNIAFYAAVVSMYLLSLLNGLLNQPVGVIIAVSAAFFIVGISNFLHHRFKIPHAEMIHAIIENGAILAALALWPTTPVFIMLGPVMMKGVIIAGWPLALSVVALISLIMLNDETGFLSGLPLKPLSGEFFAIITFYSANAFLGILMRLSWQARHRAEDLSRQLSQLNTNLEQRVAEQVEELERTHNLKRFLSPQVVDMILTQSGKANLAVARKNLTILFADIRGFTSLSETMEPEELIETLNEYLDAMTQIVFAHGGTLDKYLGDGIMVFVGDPVPCDDHAERAVRMASDMQAKLKELQAEWFSEERECLQMGVGIATGYVTVGNIGSRDRMEYTVIGRNVNLASRLSGQAGPGQILISQQTHRAAKEIAELKSWGEVELKGFHKPVDVFEVMRLKQISPF